MTISISYRRPRPLAIVMAATQASACRALRAARAGVERYRRWREQQLAVRALRGMDDHLLRDIGIGRSQIMSAVYGTQGSLKRRNLHE